MAVSTVCYCRRRSLSKPLGGGLPSSMKTIVAVSHICLAVFLVGCAGQKRSARERPSIPQSSTNLPLALQSFTNLWGGSVTITKKGNETWIYVTGEVNRPDRIPWTNGLTLTKALE